MYFLLLHSSYKLWNELQGRGKERRGEEKKVQIASGRIALLVPIQPEEQI